MVRNLLRRWLFPESVEAAPRLKTNNVFDHIETSDAYRFDPETYYFSIKKVDNGWIVTMRQYPESNPATKNINGPGPGFTDVIHIVTEETSLMERVASILTAEKLKRR